MAKTFSFPKKNSPTVYIFRHGLTEAVKTATAYGDTILTAPIIKEGEKAIENMANFLRNKPTDFNVSSPLTRCRQTCAIVSKITGKQFIFDERLTEFHLETRESLEDRLDGFLSEIDRKAFGKIAICTHRAVITALVARLTAGNRISEFETYDYPGPGILLEISGGNMEIINFNN